MTKPLLLLYLLTCLVAVLSRAQAPYIQWQKVFGNEHGDYPKKVLPSADGGYLVAGYREGGVYPTGPNSAFVDQIISVTKYDAYGKLLWENAVIGPALYMGDMVQTADGGYLIVTGAWTKECEGLMNTDVYAIRLNANGDIIWKNHYGGSSNEEAYSVEMTPDGNYIVAAATRSADINGFHGDRDIWVIKINDAGSLLWEKALGGSLDEAAYAVAVNADGSALIGGFTESNDGDVSGRKGPRDAWVVKLTSGGSVQWSKCYGGSQYEMCNSITRAHNGGFILAVQASSSDGDVTGQHNTLGPFSDFWMLNIDVNGNIIWNRCYGGLFNETPFDVQQTYDGGYIVAGSAESANGDVTCNKGNEDIWLIKLAGNGTLQWQKSFGGALYEHGFSVQQLSDHSFILAGQTCSQQIPGYHPVSLPAYSTCSDYLIIKLSTEGIITPAMSVDLDDNSAKICVGQTSTIYASVKNLGVNSIYSWTKNGTVIGGNSPYYTSSDLAVGDVIRCSVISEGSCETGGAIAYDEIQLTQKSSTTQPEISITSSMEVLCNCNPVVFRATVKNIGADATYTWLVNGKNKFTNMNVLMLDNPKPGDVVTCEYTDATNCLPGGKLVSNSIQLVAGGSAIAGLSIAAASTTVCDGTPVRIKATPVNAGARPTYTWKLNGLTVGSNADSLILTSPQTGDRIQCEIHVDPQFSCVSNTIVNSNEIQLTVKERLNSSVHLAHYSSAVCKGEQAELTVETQNIGNNPGYQWMINGQQSSQNTSIFRSSNLSDGDEVYCIVTPGDDVCDATAIQSERVIFTVHDAPQVVIYPVDTIVKRNAVVDLKTYITGEYLSLTWKPSSLVVNAFSANTSTVPLRESCELEVTVTNQYGCIGKATSKINIWSALFMPNAFTPNGDGRNDVFRIPEGTTLTLLEFSVFDRWGNRVFTTTDIGRAWKGLDNAGRALNNGTYVYVIRGTDDKGVVLKKGTVVLIR